jgi:4-amino-4-deoxy-L-arabinose transferase-like glycosyltransferase
MIVGLGLWWAFVRWGPSASQNTWRLAMPIVAAGLLLRIVFAIAVPAEFGADEAAHFSYVRYVYENQSLPIHATEVRTAFVEREWEYHQPPLYYAMLAPLYALATDVAGCDRAQTYRVLRLFTILLWCLTVWLGVRVWSRLQIQSPLAWSIFLCMLSLLPGYVYVSAMVTNDALLAALSAGVFCLLAGTRSAWRSLGVGVLLGLALLTKMSAMFVAIPIPALVFLRWVSGHTTRKQASTDLVLMLVPALLLFSPLAVRNQELYGSIMGVTGIGYPEFPWSSGLHAFTHSCKFLMTTFWAVAGPWNGSRFAPFVGMSLTGLSLAALAYGAIRHWRSLRDGIFREHLWYLAATGLGIAVIVAATMRIGLIYNQAQGRFLLPYLIPIALYFAVSFKLTKLEHWLARPHLHAAGFFLTYVLSFAAFVLRSFAEHGS